jgi:murein DD-endopeptidase MepM/ murein hydrolase activator NlpD
MSVRSPLKSRKVTSGFRTKLRPSHNGTDYRAPKGTDLFAAVDGVVKTGTGHPNAGTWVEIHTDDGILAGYSHLSSRSVKSGQRVTAGQKIGESGSTGRAFGAHLHFYVKVDGRYTNPEVWLTNELKRQEAAAKPKPSGRGKTTADWLSRAQIRNLQAGLRKKYPAYKWWVKVKRGQLITVDGIDGPQTQAWVGEFQRRTGLKPDKIAGPNTIAELRRRGIDI